MEKKKPDNKKKTAELLSYVFSFLLSLLLVFTAILSIGRIAISERSITGLVQNDELCGILLKDIEEKVYDFTIPTDIDPSVPEGVFDTAEIKLDLVNHISSSFNGSKYEPDTDALKLRLKTRATEFFRQNSELTEEIAEVIDAYCDDIASLYENSLSITGLKHIAKFYISYSHIFPVVVLVAAIGILLLARLCVKLHRYRHRGLRYVAYATGGAALILFVGPFMFYLSKIYTRVNLTSYLLHYLLVAFVEKTLMLFFASAGILFVATVILIFIISKMKAKL